MRHTLFQALLKATGAYQKYIPTYILRNISKTTEFSNMGHPSTPLKFLSLGTTTAIRSLFSTLFYW